MMELTPRVPPNSNEAEISVLGSILLDNDQLEADVLAELTPGMFYREGHRKIFAAMRGMQAEGKPVELIGLQEVLSVSGQLDEVGGLTYLIGLSEQVPTAVYADHYAAIVREKWTLREIISQSGKVMQAAYDAQQPLEDILAQAGQIGANLEVSANRGAFDVADVVSDILADLEAGTGAEPLSTGWTDLDDQLGGGLYPSTLNILAARPSMGKTAGALGIAQHVAGQLALKGDEGQVAVVSLEMPRHALTVRMLASSASLNATAVRKALRGAPVLSEPQKLRLRQKGELLAGLPLTFLDDPTSDADIRRLPAALRRLHKQKPLRLVVIDYLQLMTGGGENRQQEISAISRKLKALAREFGIPFVVLSQLSRAVEQRPNHRPMLSDLRESGAVEQDADVVMFIYRDEYYNPDTDQQGVAEWIIGKQRDGAVGTVKLQFHNEYVRFANLAVGSVGA